MSFVSPSFTIFWFGLGALAVGGLLWLVPSLGLTAQILLWAVFSSLLTAFWFLFMKPRMQDKTSAGMSREALLGETGQVIREPEGARLGSDEGSFSCDEPVRLGDRVQIRDVSGNTLIVAPKNK